MLLFHDAYICVSVNKKMSNFEESMVGGVIVQKPFLRKQKLIQCSYRFICNTIVVINYKPKELHDKLGRISFVGLH